MRARYYFAKRWTSGILSGIISRMALDFEDLVVGLSQAHREEARYRYDERIAICMADVTDEYQKIFAMGAAKKLAAEEVMDWRRELFKKLTPPTPMPDIRF